jgi:hypothetical protein
MAETVWVCVAAFLFGIEIIYAIWLWRLKD